MRAWFFQQCDLAGKTNKKKKGLAKHNKVSLVETLIRTTCSGKGTFGFSMIEKSSALASLFARLATPTSCFWLDHNDQSLFCLWDSVTSSWINASNSFLFFVLKVYRSERWQLMSVNSRRGGFTYSRTDLFDVFLSFYNLGTFSAEQAENVPLFGWNCPSAGTKSALKMSVKYLTFFSAAIIWGHFQPSRLKMSHFSAEIVPRPDKISAENVRKISDFFLAGTISGQFQRWNCPAQGHFQRWICPDGDIFSAEFVPTVKYLRGRFVFPYKVQALFESSLLSGSFLIKFSSLSASTTAEDWQPDQTQKQSAAPLEIEPRVLQIPVALFPNWFTHFFLF